MEGGGRGGEREREGEGESREGERRKGEEGGREIREEEEKGKERGGRGERRGGIERREKGKKGRSERVCEKVRANISVHVKGGVYLHLLQLHLNDFPLLPLMNQRLSVDHKGEGSDQPGEELGHKGRSQTTRGIKQSICDIQ